MSTKRDMNLRKNLDGTVKLDMQYPCDTAFYIFIIGKITLLICHIYDIIKVRTSSDKGGVQIENSRTHSGSATNQCNKKVFKGEKFERPCTVCSWN